MSNGTATVTLPQDQQILVTRQFDELVVGLADDTEITRAHS